MATETSAVDVKVPDIGDFDSVPVIEIHVAVGDVINEEDPLITLESDKATMDIPSPVTGTVREVRVQVGDQVSEGSDILLIAEGDGAEGPPSVLDQQEPKEAAQRPEEVSASAPASSSARQAAATPSAPVGSTDVAAGPAGPADMDVSGAHAGPSVRRLAREFGIDLGQVQGSGPKGRITRDDLLGTLRGPATGSGAAPAAAAAPTSGIPEIPAQDFSKFGETETVALGRIKKLSGPHLHRSWLNVPHVTHSDEADITEIDAYRKELDTAAKAEGYRVTLLAFLMKAAVSALRAFPEVNASLSPDKGSLILKRYYNIGIAVDTPGGLVVPVVTAVDRKGVTELSKNLGELSAKARDGKLSAAEMSGGTFTISSLGGIGGTGFTPIVNAPELAILGVVRSKMAPVWDGESFVPRMMLPLSLSYDHRVIDGALAARFTRHLCSLLEDLRKMVL
jgi:pyruvate dehydrogenase E2 component (dihydrolipoamide acetyltransferase)